jgi:hypothetical protein
MVEFIRAKSDAEIMMSDRIRTARSAARLKFRRAACGARSYERQPYGRRRSPPMAAASIADPKSHRELKRRISVQVRGEAANDHREGRVEWADGAHWRPATPPS